MTYHFDLSKPYPELAVEAIELCIKERWPSAPDWHTHSCACCDLGAAIAIINNRPDIIFDGCNTCDFCPLGLDNKVCGPHNSQHDILFFPFDDDELSNKEHQELIRKELRRCLAEWKKLED